MCKIASTFIFFLLASLVHSQNVTSINDMLEGRNAHVVFPVTGGAVVAGGSDAGNVITGIEFYDQANDEWNSVGDMMEARAFAQVASIQGEKGYDWIILGGWNGLSENFASTELINTTSFETAVGPAMSVGRSYHRICYLQDQSICITGGFDGIQNLSSCEILSFFPLSIVSIDQMYHARSSHTSTTLANGLVLVTGGFNPDFDFQMDECETYDAQDDEWNNVAPLLNARDNHAAVLLPNGHVLVSGGRYFNGELNLFEGMTSCEMYDPQNDEWTEVAPTNHAHSYHQMFMLSDNLVLLPGGTNHSGSEVELTYSPSEIYNITDNEWIDASDLNMGAGGRFQYAATQLSPGCVLVCGGEESASYSGEIYCLANATAENESVSTSHYPNPANEESLLTFTGEHEGQLDIRDAQGRLVFTTFISRGQMSLKIDTSKYDPGTYCVAFNGDFIQTTSKMIVIH